MCLGPNPGYHGKDVPQIHPHNFRSVRCVIDPDMTHRFHKNSGPARGLIPRTELFSGFLRFSPTVSELNITISKKNENVKKTLVSLALPTKIVSIKKCIQKLGIITESLRFLTWNLKQIFSHNFTLEPNDKWLLHFLPLASLGIIADFQRRWFNIPQNTFGACVPTTTFFTLIELYWSRLTTLNI